MVDALPAVALVLLGTFVLVTSALVPGPAPSTATAGLAAIWFGTALLVRASRQRRRLPRAIVTRRMVRRRA